MLRSLSLPISYKIDGNTFPASLCCILEHPHLWDETLRLLKYSLPHNTHIHFPLSLPIKKDLPICTIFSLFSFLIITFPILLRGL